MAASALNIERQIKYWQRNLKTLLPTEYTSTDSSRGMLGYLILAALDLLGVGVDTLPADDIKNFRTWILNCQHPNGGFCGSPNHKYPKAYYSEDERGEIDPANLPATFFAILVLSFVGKLADMDRNGCLRWLKKLQREDGSFGEMLGENGVIVGGRDMRYAFFAAGVRWMLRGDLEPANGEEFADIDVDELVRYIRSAEVSILLEILWEMLTLNKTYDGGIAESSEHEAHGTSIFTQVRRKIG
jgi:geranylgeranyl transferase type-1 subunit beta